MLHLVLHILQSNEPWLYIKIHIYVQLFQEKFPIPTQQASNNSASMLSENDPCFVYRSKRQVIEDPETRETVRGEL